MVKIKKFDVLIKTLGVRHILDLKKNLISLSIVDSKRYKYIGDGGVLKASKCVLIVMKGQKRSPKLYLLQGLIVTGDATVATLSLSDGDVIRLWHMHLGHISENRMVELSRR